jgi:hypothetical protein
MANPLIAALQSLVMTEDVGGLAPSKGTPNQVTASAVTRSGIVSADLVGTNAANYVLHVFEALDGDCKGQKVLALQFDPDTDTVNVTPFWKTSPTTLQFKHWVYPWAMARPTATGMAVNAITTLDRTEANSTFDQWQYLSMYGGNTEVREIETSYANSSFVMSADLSAAADIGDAGLLVQAIQPSGVEITADPGTVIEREIITDSLDPEGIVIGSQEELGVTAMPEIRGLAVAAGDGVVASAPKELHVALGAAFTENLDTGDTDQGSSSTSVVNVSDGDNFTQYGLGLVNGDVFSIEEINTNALTPGTGHLSGAPASGDIVYAGANYRPVDSGHKSCSMLGWIGDTEMAVLTGGLAEWGAEIQPNGIAKYSQNWQFSDGFRATFTKPHDDLYDTSTPLVGKSNVNRIVLDGTELDADLISASFQLLPAPQRKGAAFGAAENKGGMLYTARNAGASLSLQMEDSSYWHRFRALDEFDLLVQVGSIATAAWAIHGVRCQIVELSDPPEEGDGLLRITVGVRFLRPTTQGRPAFVFAHF